MAMRRMIARASSWGHVIGNRASLLFTKAPMRRIPNEVSGHQASEEGPSRGLDGRGKLAERPIRNSLTKKQLSWWRGESYGR